MMLSACASVLLGAAVVFVGPRPAVPVRRMVTTAPSLTEAVVRYGCAERLVGVSRYDRGVDVQALPRLGGLNDVSVEEVVRLHPDAVFVATGPANRRAVEALGRVGIPVVAFSLTTLDDVDQAMSEIAHLLQRDDQYLQWRSEFEQAKADIRAAALPGYRRPRIMFVYGFSPLVVAGSGSFAHQLLQLAGGENGAGNSPTAYPTWPWEKLVREPLDAVVVVGGMGGDGTRDEERLRGLVKTRWLHLDSRAVLQPGPALAHALRDVAAVVERIRLDISTADSSVPVP